MIEGSGPWPNTSGERKLFDEGLHAVAAGDHYEIFEKSLSAFIDPGLHALALNSGTAAIHLALLLLGIKSGDEVLCQSFTYVASANPILYVGATPIFVDSSPRSPNLSPDYLRLAIEDRIKRGKKPKVIIAVHAYGNPYDIETIHSIATQFEIPIIEDSAGALGSTYQGKKCSGFGKFGILSFNRNKIISTGGGGALMCRSEEERLRGLALATQAKLPGVGYDHARMGFNYRMNVVAAYLGSHKIKNIAEELHQRRDSTEFYKSVLADIQGVGLYTNDDPNGTSNHWQSIAICERYKERTAFDGFKMLLEKNNIGFREVWKPLHLQKYFEEFPYYGNNNCELFAKFSFSLPFLTENNKKQKDFIKNITFEHS